MSQPVAFEVELNTAMGPLRGRVAIDPSPMRLAELVPQALELTDMLTARTAQAETREGRELSCAKGCAACCRQPVPLSIPEVFFVADLVARLPDAMREPVLAGFRRAEAALERAGQIPVWLASRYDEEAALALSLPYFRLGIPCPFLAREACGVHPARPSRCREYGVTTPATWCAVPEAHPVRVVPSQPMSAWLAQLTAELTGTPVRLVPLTLALRWADDNRELGQRSWAGPELFAAFLRHLARPKPPG